MILNLTQHNATKEQALAGVVEPTDKKAVQALLTFNNIPKNYEIHERAEALASYAEGVLEDRPKSDPDRKAMIGGAPYLMPGLEGALLRRGITPMYAFTKRECIETPNEDGSVSKTMVFRHEGFIEV